MGKKPTSKDALNFEEALAEVERIVERIERADIGLEASITEYERGVELVRRCREVLKKAELRVEELNARMLAEEPGEDAPDDDDKDADD